MKHPEEILAKAKAINPVLKLAEYDDTIRHLASLGWGSVRIAGFLADNGVPTNPNAVAYRLRVLRKLRK